MIKKTSLHKLNNNELNTLTKRIITALAALAFINTGTIAKILAKLTELNEQLTHSLNTSFKTGHGAILKRLDERRDDAFRALRDSINGCSRRLNRAFRKNAPLLLDTISVHGWSLWNENYQEESSKMNSLIVDFEKEDAKKALQTLELIDWFTEMKEAQEAFENAFQDKATDDIKKDFVALKKIRPQLIKKLGQLVNRINSDSEFADNPDEYEKIFSTLNTIIEETAVIVKARQTRNADNKDD